jgi:hypothetical protein
MRLPVVLAASLAAVTALHAADAGPHLTPGLYELTTQVRLPPELADKVPGGIAPRVTRHCITAEQASDYYRAVHPPGKEAGADARCAKPEVHDLGGGAIAFDVDCDGHRTHVEGHFGAEGYEVDVQGGEHQGFGAHVVAHRVGECPATR